MAEKVVIGNAELWHGDCLELMRGLPDASVDMVLCDLPYGTTQNKWDSVLPLDQLWSEYRRVCTGAIVLTAAQPFTSAVVMSNIREFKYAWTWDKVNRPTGHLNAKRQPMRQTEDVLVFYQAQPTYNPQMVQGEPYRATGSNKSGNYGAQRATTTVCDDGMRYPRNLLAIPADERGAVGRVHPTQKPVALMEYLVKTYTNEGDVVLDNTMGSGTTGVACAKLGRQFIGIEREREYFDIARERIARAQAQGQLLPPELAGAPEQQTIEL